MITATMTPPCSAQGQRRPAPRVSPRPAKFKRPAWGEFLSSGRGTAIEEDRRQGWVSHYGMPKAKRRPPSEADASEF